MTAESQAVKLERLEGKIDTLTTKVDATFERLAATIDYGDRQNAERLTATKEALTAQVASLRSEMAMQITAIAADAETNRKRIDASEDRIRSNFRLIVSSLLFPFVVTVVGAILIYALLGQP